MPFFALLTIDVKAMVDKTACALAGIKAVETNCTIRHCIVHGHVVIIKIVPVSLKNILHETVKLNFINC